MCGECQVGSAYTQYSNPRIRSTGWQHTHTLGSLDQQRIHREGLACWAALGLLRVWEVLSCGAFITAWGPPWYWDKMIVYQLLPEYAQTLIPLLILTLSHSLSHRSLQTDGLNQQHHPVNPEALSKLRFINICWLEPQPETQLQYYASV